MLDNQEQKQQIEKIGEIVRKTEENPLLLNNSSLNKIFNKDNTTIDLNQQQDQIVRIIKQCESLQLLMREKSQDTQVNQEFQFKKQLSNKGLANHKYDKYFECSSEKNIMTAQISFDNKYVVIGGWDKKISLFDLQMKKILKSIQINQDVMLCKFDQNSKYLMCEDASGYLYCYDVNNQFKELYNKNIHSDWINDIIIENDLIITCSSDTTIKYTDLKQFQTELLFQSDQKELIYGLQYDQQRNVLISCQSNGSIKFINKKNGDIVFQRKKAHPENVLLMEFISNNNNLLSSDLENLILWQIDYVNNKLIRLKEYNEQNFNFTSVCNHQKIILICKQHVKILDNNLNVIEEIDHDIIEFWNYFITIQLNEMNYLIIPGAKSIRIKKRK